MPKLLSVIRHEYKTIVKQPAFWLVMIAIPTLFAAIMLISYFGSKTSIDRLEQLSKEISDVVIVDDSGYIIPEAVTSSGQQVASSSELPALKDQVREGSITGLIYYPENLSSDVPYDIYVSSNDFTLISTLQSMGSSILQSNLYAPLGSPEAILLAQGGGTSTLTIYDEGQETAGFNEYIVPGLFTIMFFLVLLFSVGYMLTSISEEKENRSMEMALTYVNPRTLIVGKLLAVVLVTLTQLLFFAAIAFIAYLVAKSFGNELVSLPAGIDLSKIVFDPLTIFFSVGFLVTGFMLLAGFMAITAAALPAKQANSFSAVFYLAGFAPFYFIQLIMTDPENPVTKFVTFFPLTSPVVTQVRNTVGNIEPLEASLTLGFMALCMMGAIWLAVRVFRLGALEFNNRIPLKAFIKG